jgi:Plasmid recombination enzyme
MSGAAFLRLKKLKGGGIIGKAARHNRRAIQAELGASGTIDPARSVLNETLRGPPTADDVAALATDLMRAAGVGKQRKNGVLGVEILFSLPADHQLDEGAYFRDCVAWAASQFGGASNILSADIHRDEAAPHCHVLLLPMLNGRMVGSDMVGDRRKLLDTQQRFHQAVAARYGLKKAPHRLTGATRAAAVSAVLDRLRNGSDGALRSKIWPQLRETIEADPGPYLLALGIVVGQPAKRLRTMTQIFTSPGRGKAREEKPIGFQAARETPSLCSVGNASPPAPQAAPQATPATNKSTRTATTSKPALLDTVETVRVRDCDLDASAYDFDTGEFARTPKRRVSQLISYSVKEQGDG